MKICKSNSNNDITIAICTFNRYEKLYKLLDALNKQTYKRFNVIVMDSSSDFKEINSSLYIYDLKQVKAEEPNLPLQRWNSAVICETKYIGFFDDDVIPQINYIEVLVNRFKSNEDIVGLSGWFENVPKRKRGTMTHFRYLLSGINLKNQGKISMGGFAIPFDKKPQKMTKTEFLSGGSMFYKTEVFTKNCFMPWLYEMYRHKQGRAEDLAVSGYLNKLGFYLYYEPNIVYFHHEEDGGSAFAKKGFNKGIADSYTRLQVYKLVSKEWNLLNWIAYLRYFSINFFLLNLFDFHYQKGLLYGFIKILKQK